MRGKRIFLAIDLSKKAREICAEHVEGLRTRYKEANVGWERPEKLHVTLKFLGDTAEYTLRDLEEKIAEIAAHHKPFHMTIDRTGVFPNRSRPRILWIGLRDAGSRFTEIHRSIDEACGKLGLEADRKNFTAHVTVGRIRTPGRTEDLIESHLKAQIEPVEFEVADVVIYESKLQPTGSVYTVVSKSPLLGR